MAIHSEPYIRFGRKLGEGTAGTVYKATFSYPNQKARKCAVKVFKKATDSFESELEVYKKLLTFPHENFLTLFFGYYRCKKMEIGIFGMSRFHGNHLGCYLLPAEEIQLVTDQLVSAFSHLHDTLKVVHGDPKPENVLYNSKTRQIKVIDFGSGFFLGEQCGDWCSYEYKSPAALLKEDFGTEIDRWGASLLVYFMVFKKELFSLSPKHKSRLCEAKRILRFTYYPTKRKELELEIDKILNGVDEPSLKELVSQQRVAIGSDAPEALMAHPRYPQEPLSTPPINWEERFNEGYSAARSKEAQEMDEGILKGLACFFRRCLQWEPEKFTRSKESFL